MNMRNIVCGMLAVLMAAGLFHCPVNVYALEQNGLSQPENSVAETTKPAKPVKLAATKPTSVNQPADGKIKISWKQVKGAKSYNIYRTDTSKGTYKKIASTSQCVYVDKSAKEGTRYYYKVRAIASSKDYIDSSLSTRTYRYCDLKRPVVKTTLTLAAAKPHVSWDAIAGASKYSVYVSTAEEGPYQRVAITEKTYYAYTQAKTGCKYYFKVRALSKKSTAANSALSEVKMRTCGAPYIVSSTDKEYTYGDFKTDMDKLVEKYPDILKKKYLGKTADNRGLYALIFGNPDSDKQIFVTAGFHAREYINCQLTMRMIENYCRTYKTGSYEGVSYEELFDEVSLCILPMVNPDGIAISTNGPSAIRDKNLRSKVQKMPKENGYYFWKANARGVDLNRNYIVYKGIPDVKSPASEGYGGAKRYSEKETQAVRKAMDSCSNIKAVINYHSMGNAIYWGYHNKNYKESCWDFAEIFYDMTGYYMIDESYSNNARGDFEHYVMHEYKIPYVCIETGKTKVPVPISEFITIYHKNKLGFAKAAYHFY